MEMDPSRMEMDPSRMEMDPSRMEMDPSSMEMDPSRMEMDPSSMDFFECFRALTEPSKKVQNRHASRAQSASAQDAARQGALFLADRGALNGFSRWERPEEPARRRRTAARMAALHDSRRALRAPSCTRQPRSPFPTTPAALPDQPGPEQHRDPKERSTLRSSTSIDR